MLDREQLYLTDVGKSACEAAARANMSHEWRLAFGGQLLQANGLGKGFTAAAYQLITGAELSMVYSWQRSKAAAYTWMLMQCGAMLCCAVLGRSAGCVQD
jgi:hypothetical protein